MTALLCPLCSQPRFNNLESLRISLINAATQSICCPICSEVLVGLDKLTIHLFGHTLHQNAEKRECLELTIGKGEDVVSTDCVSSAASTNEQFLSEHLVENVSSKTSGETEEAEKASTVNVEDLSFLTSWENSFRAEESKNTSNSVVRAEEGEGEGGGREEKEEKDEGVGLSEYMSDLLNKKLPVLNFSFAMDTEEEKAEETSEQFKCSACDFSFQNSIILSMHQELAHSRASKQEESPDVRSLTLALPRYDCHLCPKSFKMKGSLLVHYRVAHLGAQNSDSPTATQSGAEEKTFRCSICSKSFKKEQHLTQHIKTHEGKQWQCGTCNKHFTTKYFLKKHQRLHTGEMPYSCQACNKTFTFQQSYHKHLLYHSDEKPHKCSQCGRSFKELSTLHNHQRIHSGEKPFACETCGKCFRQRVSYIVHQRIHTGVLPYQCTSCKKRFRYKVSQRSHKCTAHPPGTVVRQTGDLIQRILEHRSGGLPCAQ